MMMSKPDFLTLPAVLPDVALLTQAVVFCARSPVHAADVTVLDCGEMRHGHIYSREHMQPRVAEQQRPQIMLQSHAQI